MPTDSRTAPVIGGDDALGAGLQRALRRPLLSVTEERLLARRAARGDRTAGARLVEANIRLVVALARAHRGRGVSHADLVQEGMLGLLKAVERFDPERGNRLATYATWWIRSSMLAAISASPTIRLPAARTRELAAILRTERELAGAGRPRPGADLVADRTGVPLSQVERLRTAPHVVASLDAHLAGSDATFAEFVADPGVPEMTADIDRDEAQRALRAALSRLTPRVRRVLTLRFGLDGAPELSHDQIGRVLGLSAERSRQLEVEGLRRLRPLAERASLAA